MQVFEECSLLLKQTNFEIIRVKVTQQISEMSDKLLEFESIMNASQKVYRSKLEKILDMRRQAETNFLEERQKFSSVV